VIGATGAQAFQHTERILHHIHILYIFLYFYFNGKHFRKLCLIYFAEIKYEFYSNIQINKIKLKKNYIIINGCAKTYFLRNKVLFLKCFPLKKKKKYLPCRDYLK
jgi:hypothetical protein